MRALLSLSFWLLLLTSRAQLPETDIWYFKLEKDKLGALQIKEGSNISNRKGYDNQPAFSANGRLLYYSAVYATQSDIYVYDIRHKKTKQLTATPESEYSPCPVLNTNTLSTVVVEADSSQHLKLLDAGTGTVNLRYAYDSVGYVSFLNLDTVVYFKIGEPQTLRYHVSSSGEDRLICKYPTRSILVQNRHSILFGSKDSANTSFYTYDFFLRKAILYCQVQGSAEDAQWVEGYGLLRSEGSQVLRYDVRTATWPILFDFKTFGLSSIARFRFDPLHMQMAVVQVSEMQ